MAASESASGISDAITAFVLGLEDLVEAAGEVRPLVEAKAAPMSATASWSASREAPFPTAAGAAGFTAAATADVAMNEARIGSVVAAPCAAVACDAVGAAVGLFDDGVGSDPTAGVLVQAMAGIGCGLDAPRDPIFGESATSAAFEAGAAKEEARLLRRFCKADGAGFDAVELPTQAVAMGAASSFAVLTS